MVWPGSDVPAVVSSVAGGRNFDKSLYGAIGQNCSSTDTGRVGGSVSSRMLRFKASINVNLSLSGSALIWINSSFLFIYMAALRLTIIIDVRHKNRITYVLISAFAFLVKQ